MSLHIESPIGRVSIIRFRSIDAVHAWLQSHGWMIMRDQITYMDSRGQTAWVE